MSANAELLQGSELMGSSLQETALPQVEISYQVNSWNAETFAREQILGLVRRVFFTDSVRPARQLVISAADLRTDVGAICAQVGQTLALETSADIAIVSREQRAAEMARVPTHLDRGGSIKSWASRISNHLWIVPEFALRQRSAESGAGRYWLARLAELRNEFEYSVIHGPTAGQSSEATLLGQLADGVILVLDAHCTRRATARKIKETFEGAQTRILGTVLSGRTFPIPQGIYRRL